ncbi:MAG TPA: LytTR family DNA-binding domain-containing protein [Terriglobales bacterium]|nr:LytTR family DNA-binding domain-containing protein [Terriglobales bacterium]
MTQEDIIKRYYAGSQDCDPRQHEYKGYAAPEVSGRLAQTALASILATSSDAEECESANDAIEAPDKLEKRSNDIPSLDTCTPEGSGLELRNRLEENGHQVSVVASPPARDEHAITAIEKRAVDHVLRPSSADRIKKASDAAFRGTAEERAAGLAETPPQQRQSTRIAIKANGRIVFIDPDDVIAVEAEGNYVSVRRRSDSYLLRESISIMAEILKPYGFVRIHRSVLVNSSFVEQIQSRLTGGYGLRVKGGKEYTVTRTYKNNLKSLAAAWIGTDILFDE